MNKPPIGTRVKCPQSVGGCMWGTIVAHVHGNPLGLSEANSITVAWDRFTWDDYPYVGTHPLSTWETEIFPDTGNGA